MRSSTIFMLATMIALPAFGGSFHIDWYTMDCGGGTSAGGGLALSGSIGQTDAGVIASASYSLVGGFWGVAVVGVPPAPGDCDANGDVDLDDYAELPACLDGPGGGLASPTCDCLDFDADIDVDLLDFAQYQALIGG